MYRSSQSESGRSMSTFRQLILLVSVLGIALTGNHLWVGKLVAVGPESSVWTMSPWISQNGSSSSSSLASFSLAYNQSFGFFDDVTDRQWKLSQVLHAKTFPNHFSKDLKQYSSTINDKGNIPMLRKSSFWYAENFQEEFHCR